MKKDFENSEFDLGNENIDSYSLLHSFLNVPLTDSDKLFSLFCALPNVIQGIGEKPKQRYVYIPGTRPDRILLAAHADTVWDTHYGKSENTDVNIVFEKGVFHNSNTGCGIGADDRAGCAMLWAFRGSGHSLLLLDGEEHGKIGARYLKKSNPKLFREINRHRFMIELDTRGINLCLFNQVDYTEKFTDYIKRNLNVKEDAANKGGCDLQVLCHKVCGVNLGIGYHNYHSPSEFLRLEEWENVYNSLNEFLKKSHPKFPISKRKRLVKNIKWLFRIPIRLKNKLFKKK